MDTDEDEAISFNCLYFNLSPKCFTATFGERGLEFGEIAKHETLLKFNNCWKEGDVSYNVGATNEE